MPPISYLVPGITNILSAPDVDLTQISAKAVRKALLASDSTLDPEWVKSNKESIDELIGQIFNTVNQPQASTAPASSPPPSNKRKRSDGGAEASTHHQEDEVLPPSQTPIAYIKPRPVLSSNSRVKSEKSQELSDAELARQLSAELNSVGRSTRGSNGSASGNRKAKGSSKKVKSSAKIVDESDEEGGYSGSEEPAKKKRKKREGGGAKGGFAKEYLLSEPLAALTGETQLSRPGTVKALWKHIKENQLQNPRNGREILCDDLLRAVFRTEKIDMFKMNKELGAHLFELGAAP